MSRLTTTREEAGLAIGRSCSAGGARTRAAVPGRPNRRAGSVVGRTGGTRRTRHGTPAELSPWPTRCRPAAGSLAWRRACHGRAWGRYCWPHARESSVAWHGCPNPTSSTATTSRANRAGPLRSTSLSDDVAALPSAVGDELLRRGAWARCVQIVGTFEAVTELTVAHTPRPCAVRPVARQVPGRRPLAGRDGR